MERPEERPLVNCDPNNDCEELIPASITPMVIPCPCAVFQAVGTPMLLKFQGSFAAGEMVVKSAEFTVVVDPSHPEEDLSIWSGQ